MRCYYAAAAKVARNTLQQQRRYFIIRPTPPSHQSSNFRHDDRDMLKQRINIIPGGNSPNYSRKQNKKKKKKEKSQMPFIDRINLKAKGGTGGRGCISFHRIGSYKKKPSGGHGGKGGNVYLVTDPTLSSLKMEKHHYTGQDGGRGGTNAMQGKNGKDVYIRVPCGVVVRKVLDWDEIEEMYGKDENSEVEEEEEGEDEEHSNIHLPSYANNNQASFAEEQDDLQMEASSNNELNDENSDDSDNNKETANEEEDEELDEEEDFDTYYERLQLSKRQRKRRRKPRGSTGDDTPSDYDDVVDTGVRSDDGYFYWSPPETTNDGSSDMMAPTAYPDYQYDASNPIRKTVFLADLDKPQSSLLVANGGKAGVGNIAYANRPHFSGLAANAATKTIPENGGNTYLELELKLIADVGLVGFPNAGKSSLLSAMSRARPKIASYPFTTLHPLTGAIQYRDGFKVVMADIPGLIAGAAEGRGRGVEFLRHIERTKALVYMVDGVGVDGRDPVNDLKILGKELKEYGSSGIYGENEMDGDEGEYGEEMRRRRREIMNRPSLILANKMDLISDDDAQIGRRKELLFQLSQAAEEVGIVCETSDVMGISAGVSGEGLRVLSKRLRQVVNTVQ